MDPLNVVDRRIMCFEPLFGHQGRVIRHPAELVGEVFRCLIPLCNNEEKTVLSPLLATGDAVSLIFNKYNLKLYS